MELCKRIVAGVVVAILLQVSVYGFEVSSTPAGTVLFKTDPPDYGNYGYRYAPTLIRRSDSKVDCWFCAGIARRTNPDDSRDHVLYTLDWITPEVTLCAKDEDSRVPNPLCESLYKAPPGAAPVDDHYGVCDPTVIKVNGQYWMYYTAEPDGGGDDAQMFIANSTDGRTWTKHPNNSVPAVPILPFPDPALAEFQRGKYGIGEGSALYKDGQFWLYYTYHPYNGGEGNSIYLSKSTDGITFPRGERLFSESTIPFLGGGGNGGLDVKYIPGWNLFFYVAPTADKQDLAWNISRDGQHWLPWSSTSFGYQTRRIPLPRRYAISPAIDGNDHGHIGDGTLASSQSARIVFAAGDTAQATDGFWLWTLDAVDIVITPQPLYGRLDSVDSNNIASGWAYDPDTGTNDSAANGGPSGPLGHDTWVRPVAVSTTTGQIYEGRWQSAQVRRDDLVAAGAAPDPYHGFRIDLHNQGFPAGTYRVHVQGGEFPTGMGGTDLVGEIAVTIASPCTAPSITSQPSSTSVTSGTTVTLSVSATGTTPLQYQWYTGTSGDTASPLIGETQPTLTVSPPTTSDYWARVSNSCGIVNSSTATITVTPTCTAPTITQQPMSQAAVPGTMVSFTVAASGTSPLAFQWYVGATGDTSSPVSGASTSALALVADVPAKSYWVEARNTCGAARSVAALVTPMQPVVRLRAGDYDGDGRSDRTVYRPFNGTWYIQFATGGSTAVQWGLSTDIPAQGDYDGDGKTDIVAWRPSNATWYFILSSAVPRAPQQWGTAGDIPVPADYDGDGDDDIAVFRPSDGTWYILLPDGTHRLQQWGLSGDVPVPVDYDGDGRDEIAVWRPWNGMWYIFFDVATTTATQWGAPGDLPVPADYNGDGTADIAVYRQSTGTWYLRGIRNQQWGAPGDVPMPGDVNGDGGMDLAVFRPNGGLWHAVLLGNGAIVTSQWGTSGDMPLTP